MVRISLNVRPHRARAAVLELSPLLFTIDEAGAALTDRSLARSALVEAATQLTRALEQMATLPTTALLRREQIKLQVAVISPLMYVKGYAAPETKAATQHRASELRLITPSRNSSTADFRKPVTRNAGAEKAEWSCI
jgi:hypothetical protein